MSDGVRKQIPFIILMSVLGLALGGTFLTLLKNSASALNVIAFDILTLVIPVLIMFICAFFIMMRADEIGSTLLVIVEVICVVFGMISLVVTSGWQADPEVAAALLANSGEGSTITPSLQNVFAIVRGFALFLFVPMIGSIAGAWVGSRLHPLSVDKNNKNYEKLQKDRKQQAKKAKKANRK